MILESKESGRKPFAGNGKGFFVVQNRSILEPLIIGVFEIGPQFDRKSVSTLLAPYNMLNLVDRRKNREWQRAFKRVANRQQPFQFFHR
jgi:hypothetical protein